MGGGLINSLSSVCEKFGWGVDTQRKNFLQNFCWAILLIIKSKKLSNPDKFKHKKCQWEQQKWGKSSAHDVGCKWPYLLFRYRWSGFCTQVSTLERQSKHHHHHHRALNNAWNSIKEVMSDEALPAAHARGRIIIYRPVGCMTVGTDIWRGLYNSTNGAMTNVQIWQRRWDERGSQRVTCRWLGYKPNGPAPTNHLFLFLVRTARQLLRKAAVTTIWLQRFYLSGHLALEVLKHMRTSLCRQQRVLRTVIQREGEWSQEKF